MIKQIRNNFYFHTFLISFLFGIACFFPDMLVLLNNDMQIFTLNKKSPILYDEARFYANGASFFMTHKKCPFDTEIYEFRNAITPIVPLPSIIIGTIACFFNQNLPLAWLITHFIFPALSLYLASWLASLYVGKNLYSWLIGLLFCSFGQGPRVFLILSEYAKAQPLIITRIEPQAVGLAFFVLFMLSISKIHIGRGETWKWIGGITGGLLFYVYLFFYSIVPFIYVFMCIFYLYIRDKKRFLDVFISGIIAFLLAVPAFIQFIYFKYSDYYPNLLLIHGTESSGQFEGSFSSAAIALACVLFAIAINFKWFDTLINRCFNAVINSEKRIQFQNHFSPLPISAIIVIAFLLEYIIDPLIFFIPHPHHYTQRIVIGFTIFLLFMEIAKRISAKHTPVIKLLSKFFLVLLIFFIFFKQFIFWQENKDERIIVEKENHVEQLIRFHTKSDDVIALRNPYYNTILPSRIHRYRFYADEWRSVVSNEENIKRYIFVQKLLGRSWNEIQDELKGLSNVSNGYYPTVSSMIASIPAIGSDKLEPYRSFFIDANVSFLQDKRLDYVVVDNLSVEEFIVSSQKMGIRFNKIATLGGVLLFKRGQ